MKRETFANGGTLAGVVTPGTGGKQLEADWQLDGRPTVHAARAKGV